MKDSLKPSEQQLITLEHLDQHLAFKQSKVYFLQKKIILSLQMVENQSNMC
jgi:hypothetical protein